MHEPFLGRDDDTAGVGLGVARVSGGASGFDRDSGFYNPTIASPVRGSETFLEATYQYQVMPWWQLQPDVQYVFNPGAGVANPNDPTHTVRNELVFGLRTNVTF
jgi:porin